MLYWVPGFDTSSRIWVSPPSKILLPAPRQQALPQNIKPERTNFISLLISLPFGLFVSYSTFLGGCFHFLVEIILEKLGKEVRFGFFYEGIWALENSLLENSLKGDLQEKQHKCVDLGIIPARRLLSIPIPLAFCLLWFMDPKGTVLLVDQECPCWISPLASH